MTIDITQADREAAEEIGAFLASWHEFNRHSDYEDGCLATARHRHVSTEELRADAERLREALAKIAARNYGLSSPSEIARAALTSKGGEG